MVVPRAAMQLDKELAVAAAGDSGVQNRAGSVDGSAVAPSQAVPLVGVPNYPNCIKWSEENLLAVAAGHVVTILNPSALSGPRGFIPVSTSPLFDVGKVQAEDLQAHSLFQFRLARDPRPGVRSIDWSPPSLSQNGGFDLNTHLYSCLLAVCTTDSRVKVYRAPFCDFQSEWVEIVDLSEMVYNYCMDNNFREAELAAVRLGLEEESISSPLKWGFKMKRKFCDDEPQHRKVQKTSMTDKFVGGMEIVVAPGVLEVSPTLDFNQQSAQRPALLAEPSVASNAVGILPSAFERGSRVEVLEEDDGLQYWVGATVIDIMDGEALVRLDRPQYGAMQEWVPLLDQPGLAHHVYKDQETENPQFNSIGLQDSKQFVHSERPRIRPLVPMETLDQNITNNGGTKRSLASGELVEAWTNDRWQEGMIVGLEGSGVIVKFSASSTNVVMELDQLRLAPCWHGKRWVWRTPGTVSNHKRAQAGHSSNHAHLPSTLGEHSIPDSREREKSGQRESLIQGLECTSNSGSIVNLALGTLEKNIFSHAMPGADQYSPCTEDFKGCFSKVYKRRGLVTGAVPPVAVAYPSPLSPPVNSCNGETVCTTRPVRSRRLPSKFRDEDIASWVPESGGSILLGRDAEQEEQLQHKDVDYVQVVRGVQDVDKAKQVSFVIDTAQVKQGSYTKDTSKSKVGRNHRREPAQQAEKVRKAASNWISAHEFAARSEVLTPLVLAWSSRYQDSHTVDDKQQGKVQKFSLLGAGMKSGRVSLWRMTCPSSYSVDHAQTSVASTFLGFLSVHDSWVTNLSWASCCNFDLRKLNPRVRTEGDEILLLATGCTDGSVKLWGGLPRDLTGPPRVNHSVPFFFLKQVVKVDCVPVTALALIVPPQPGDRALLAVGKGSGSVAVWELKSSGVFRQICLQLVAHQQMVTGFSWVYDGRCLYSCGQDSLKCWDFSQNELLPLPFPDCSGVFPSNTAADLCSLEALESFFGVALSHNSLALVAVRGIANDLLDQMYQARSQKGMVQLFWLGSEHTDFKIDGTTTNVALSPKGLCEHDKICWALNIVAALEHLQDPRQTLVLWDVVTSLSALKEKIGVEGVAVILSKWLSSWAPGQCAVGAVNPYEWESFQKTIPEASCRKLQMLNVIYRRFFLSHFKSEVLSAHSSEELLVSKDNEQVKLWKDGMHLVEHDLRQRLVHFCLQSATCGDTNPDKIAQGGSSSGTQLLVKWVIGNIPSMSPQLVQVAAQWDTNSKLLVDSLASSSIEACTFCESTVVFESPEIGTCGNSDITDGAANHRLQRCSVSMQICPPVCLWHCSCCARSAIKQGPNELVCTMCKSGRGLLVSERYVQSRAGTTATGCPSVNSSVQREPKIYLFSMATRGLHIGNLVYHV